MPVPVPAPAHRFFARSAKAGRVAEAILPPSGDGTAVELLVRVRTGSGSGSGSGDRGGRWGSVPSLMDLHEAERRGYLAPFERVAVRRYRVRDQERTASVAAASASVRTSVEEEVVPGADPVNSGTAAAPPPTRTDRGDEVPGERGRGGVDQEEDGEEDEEEALSRRIVGALDRAVEGAGPRAKKARRASDKVRRVLIRGKAEGDRKRVKDDERFYLEAVAVRDPAMGGGGVGGDGDGDGGRLGPACPPLLRPEGRTGISSGEGRRASRR